MTLDAARENLGVRESLPNSKNFLGCATSPVVPTNHPPADRRSARAPRPAHAR